MSYFFNDVRLTNWLCFRGEHEVTLGAGIFAIVAERDGDPRRSNAQGKSAFEWALRFVLTGDHPRRTEDEWITDGAPDGGVDAEFSGGLFASRWRKRGDATRLKVVTPDGRELKDDEAQAELDRIVGMNGHEQESTWWCGQGRADALVNGESGELTKDVVRWCGVEPVRRAAKRVADELRALLVDDAKLIAVAETARKAAAEIIEPPDWDALEREQLRAIERVRDLVEVDRSADEKRRAKKKLFDDVVDYERLEREQTELLKVPPGPKPEELETAQTSFDEARATEQTTKQDVAGKEKLARGEFDGVCPVGGIVCPAKDQLNSDAKGARSALADAKRRLELLRTDADSQGKALSAMRTKESGARRATERLAVIVPALVPLLASKKVVEAMTSDELTEATVSNVAQELRTAEALLADTKERRRLRALAIKQVEELEKSRQALAPEINARREALQVLGPSGAQRRLVDGFLGSVERSANEDLAKAGVDLHIAFSWQRELPDLADACHQCGQPLPSSRKVRACEACGAPRGQKIEQKLRCLVEPKSGGMDALAGVGVRLSATAWLKARRGSSWSVAVFDEPMAAVDAHNRALVGRHLVTMLGAHYGIEQAFISAHDQALLDSLPRRIVVRGGELGSSLEVVG